MTVSAIMYWHSRVLERERQERERQRKARVRSL